MRLPGFTAEVSLRPTTQTYRMRSQYGFSGPEYLAPQQDMVEDVEEVDENGVDEGIVGGESTLGEETEGEAEEIGEDEESEG